MTIINITEIQNKHMPKFQVIKENQEIYIPGIDANKISKRKGVVYILTGSGGSGKTNLIFNLFKNRHCYRNILNDLFYFFPGG